MKALLFFLSLIFITGCASNVKVDERQGKIHLRLGSSQLQQGLYPEALSNLLEAQTYIPDNDILQNNLGLAYYVRGKYKLAEKHIRKAVELNPKYTDARNNLGKILYEQGQVKEAITQLKVAAEDLEYTQPQKSYSNLGIAYFENQQFRKALNYLKKSLELRRDHCLTYTYYGRTLYKIKKFSLAAKALDNAVEICNNEDPTVAKYYAAVSHFQVGHTLQATAVLNEIIKTSSNINYTKKANKLLKIINEANQ